MGKEIHYPDVTGEDSAHFHPVEANTDPKIESHDDSEEKLGRSLEYLLKKKNRTAHHVHVQSGESEEQEKEDESSFEFYLENRDSTER